MVRVRTILNSREWVAVGATGLSGGRYPGVDSWLAECLPRVYAERPFTVLPTRTFPQG
jgi:hypothetical protein